MVLSMPYFFLFHYFEFPIAGNMILVFLLAFLGVFIVNRKGYLIASKISFMLLASLLLAFYTLVLGKNSGAYIVIVSIVHIPILLFDISEKKYFLGLATFIPIVTAYCLVAVDYELLFPQAYLYGLAEKVIHTSAITTAFLFSLLSVYIFYRSNQELLSEIAQKNLSLECAYEDLQSQQKLLEKAWHDSVYAQLTRTIAHELKNPLFEFGMVIEALKGAIDEDRETAILFINSLAQTIEELLELVHTMLETGGTSVGEIKQINVVDIMRRVLLLAEGSLKKNNVSLIKEIKDIAPIMGDSKCFLMIFSNLIVNAIEAMSTTNTDPKYEKKLIVRIHNTLKEGIQHLVIEIEDSGVGIPKERQLTLFRGGQSTKDISERQRGIGLNLVWQLIHQMGGDISVYSNPEFRPGTIFRIII